jgi:hypothetical protein
MMSKALLELEHSRQRPRDFLGKGTGGTTACASRNTELPAGENGELDAHQAGKQEPAQVEAPQPPAGAHELWLFNFNDPEAISDEVMNDLGDTLTDEDEDRGEHNNRGETSE